MSMREGFFLTLMSTYIINYNCIIQQKLEDFYLFDIIRKTVIINQLLTPKIISVVLLNDIKKLQVYVQTI